MVVHMVLSVKEELPSLALTSTRARDSDLGPKLTLDLTDGLPWWVLLIVKHRVGVVTRQVYSCLSLSLTPWPCSTEKISLWDYLGSSEVVCVWVRACKCLCVCALMRSGVFVNRSNNPLQIIVLRLKWFSKSKHIH